MVAVVIVYLVTNLKVSIFSRISASNVQLIVLIVQILRVV